MKGIPDTIATLKRFADPIRGSGHHGGAYCGATDELFACEFCKETHPDCRYIRHLESCPVSEARAIIAALEESLI